MTSDHQLDESITLTCTICGNLYHPRLGIRKLPRTCSKACAQRLRVRSCLGIPLDQIPQKGVEKECPHCHQAFITRFARQQYCSSQCQHGAALAKVRNAITPEARENLRQIQLRKIAEGAHNFIASSHRRKVESSRNTPRSHSKTKISTTHADPPTSSSVPLTYVTDSPTFPPLPELPEADEELTDEVVATEVLIAGYPLSFPLLGQQAQGEWRRAGEQRQAQADRSLRQEEVQTGEGRTIVLAGQGSYLGVEGYALIVHQGRTHGVPAPEKELFQPALHNVKRIVWVGNHGHLMGTMTLAAAAWCQNEEVHLTVLDGSGLPLIEVLPEQHQDAELKRKQWLVSSGLVLPGSPPAGAIVRELVQRKLEGQWRTLLNHPELPGQSTCLALFQDWRRWLTMAEPTPAQQDVSYLVKLEGRLAIAYFHAWEGWALSWAKTDLRRIPPHWLTVRSRISPLAPIRNGRHAIDPFNACLNYCYGCLASQCRQSLHQEGFDISGGFLHADKPGRDSLTYDLMELERGAVDALLLSFLGRTTLHYGDFARKQDGSIVLNSQLTRLLLAECRVPQSRIDAHAHWLRLFLLTAP